MLKIINVDKYEVKEENFLQIHVRLHIVLNDFGPTLILFYFIFLIFWSVLQVDCCQLDFFLLVKFDE